jgi:hypothetical protein
MPTPTARNSTTQDAREQHQRVVDAARDYRERGWKPIPIRFGDKSPKGTGAVDWQLTDRGFMTWHQNIGVQFGPVSDGLCDVDLDCAEARTLAKYFLPETGAIFGRQSSPDSHWLYLCNLWEQAATATTQFEDIEAKGEHGVMLVELRTGAVRKGKVIGAQSLFPPSVHPSGEPVGWKNEGDPVAVEGAELARCVSELAAAALLVRHYPNEGDRHTTALVLGGFLARAGWTAEKIDGFAGAVADCADDSEWRERGRSAASAVNKLRSDGAVAGTPRMRKLFGAAVVERLCEWLRIGDSDFADHDHTAHDDASTTPDSEAEPGVSASDFYAYMPTHHYIFVPTREVWTRGGVNARLPPLHVGSRGKPLPPTVWIDQNQAVDQMTWAPGEPMLIKDKLMVQGGWNDRPGARCFNLYAPPKPEGGDAKQAGPWLDHVHKVYPDDGDHIVAWLGHRVQHPQDKINHALVLGGAQGIGKDTMLEPVMRAVGSWNVHEVSPQHLLGRFNDYLKSVILRVNEARDLGEMNRYQFYDHMKGYAAAPPPTLRVDEKFIREYYVLNCCGVVITTNHKADGIYLPPDDRRHYVAWSELHKEDFDEDYWNDLWSWYDNGGAGHVAAYLHELDLSRFNAKAPPTKTPAWWDIVDANRAPEDAELADALDRMNRPEATTLSEIILTADHDLSEWLKERKNRRAIPHRLESCGYVPVRNDMADDGLWKIGGKRQVIYASSGLAPHERVAAANRLVGEAGLISEVSEVRGPRFPSRTSVHAQQARTAPQYKMSQEGRTRTEKERDFRGDSRTTDFTDFTDRRRQPLGRAEIERLRREQGRFARLHHRERDNRR